MGADAIEARLAEIERRLPPAGVPSDLREDLKPIFANLRACRAALRDVHEAVEADESAHATRARMLALLATIDRALAGQEAPDAK